MRGMDMHSRDQYLKRLLERYLKAGKKGRGEILDEYCRNTGQSRKYVIRKISDLRFVSSKRRKKREVKYDHKVRNALYRLWEIFDYPCGQRLKPLLETEIDRLREMQELKVSEDVTTKLRSISSATIDRVLKPRKGEWRYKRSSRGKSSSLLYKKIPIRLTEWDLEKVGYIEMDMVCHGGASTAGEYINSLSTAEIYSGWWEGEAVMGRGQYRTFTALEAIRDRTPFEWKGIDSDNDVVFIKSHLYKHCRGEGIEFTRSRPGRKNDNAYIEQKNYTHVGRPLGYLRYDTDDELSIIRDLYRNELRLYKNFFQPVMKLMRKERVGGRVKRVYDKPLTPHKRLIKSGQLSEEKQKEMQTLYSSLNPAQLKRSIDDKLEKLYRLYTE